MAHGLEPSEPRRPERVGENDCGRVVGDRFRLDVCMYTTATSSLFRAHDLHSGATVAVKLLHPELDEARTERAQREGRILARLRHANIAEFIDCNRTPEGLFYIATAFIDGQPLVHWCSPEGPKLQTETVWRIGLQVAEALICAHAAGVIHRDVKASNIVLPASQVVKLIDFGIAKLTPGAALELTPPRHPTAVGIPIGTQGYVPPEAGETVDERTDVFALGRTLYRLLTQRKADHWPDGLDPIPEPLRSVIMEAGSPDPSWRPATMKEFRGRLLGAGAHLFPQNSVGPSMRPARFLWPVPPDRQAAPLPDPTCSGATADDPCTATTGPRLFERRLELRVLLGRGGAGCETWRAYHHALDAQCVVKICPPALVGTFASENLRREAAVLQKLSHPAFPRVYECDHSELDGSWYMVQEFIQGETLQAVMKRGRLDVLLTVEIVAALADALGELHARGVIHGDIHESNVMIEQLSPPRLRLIDLNECRLLDHYFAVSDQRYATPAHLRETLARHTKGIRGRPQYGAPELIQATNGRVTVRSDVYSLGALLFGMLTGAQFPNAIIGEIVKAGPLDGLGARLAAHMTEAAPELEESELSGTIEDVLAPDPAHRSATMQRLAAILRSTADSIRELRSPSDLTPPARGPSWWDGPAAAPAPPVGPGVAPPGPAPAAPPAPARGARPWQHLALGLALGALVPGLAYLALNQPQVPMAAAPSPEAEPEPAPRVAPRSVPAAAENEPPIMAPGPASPPEPASASTPSLQVPAARDADPPKQRRAKPARTDPVTVEEATKAASVALPGLRGCTGVPKVIAAQLDIVGGRGKVARINFKPAAQFKPDSWETCVLGELEAVPYPKRTEPSHVGLRLER